MKNLTPPPLAPKRIAHLNSWTSFSISRDISTVSLTTALGPSITKITLIHISYIIFHIFTCYFVYFHWATDSSYCIITGGHWQRSIEHWSELWALSSVTHHYPGIITVSVEFNMLLHVFPFKLPQCNVRCVSLWWQFRK